MILFSIAIVFKLAVNKSGLIPTILSGLILSPLLLERNDVRPEIFGYFFFSFIIYLLLTYPKNQKLIYFLPVVMFLWINIHITFVFGIFLILLLIIKVFITRNKNRNNLVLLYSIIFISLLVLLLNPHGLTGIIYPFNIFKNYGYTIVENQNLFYLSKMIFNPLIKYFFFISPVIIISLIILATVHQLTVALLLFVFYVLTIFQLRHLPFFILTAIPALAISFDQILKFITRRFTLPDNLKPLIIILLMFILSSCSVFFISNKYYLVFDHSKRFGLGYNGSHETAVEFVKKNNFQGNIFNNFDIGGYFIFRFYPKYKVFIDNRPEAYPVDFIGDVYKKLQIEQPVQDKIFKKYKITTVFFNHNDQTQWAEIFIGRLLKDRNWHLVYLDPEIFMAVKDSQLKDIRDNKGIFNKMINAEKNYINLLKLSRFFSIINENKSSNEAFLKAEEINPGSCSIKKSEFNQFIANSQFYLYKAQELKRNYWYCF